MPPKNVSRASTVARMPSVGREIGGTQMARTAGSHEAETPGSSELIAARVDLLHHRGLPVRLGDENLGHNSFRRRLPMPGNLAGAKDGAIVNSRHKGKPWSEFMPCAQEEDEERDRNCRILNSAIRVQS